MMASNPQAIAHFRQWTNAKFPSARLHIGVIASVCFTSLITWLLVAAQIQEKFDWAAWIKLATLFSCGGSLFVFITRRAAIHGSWTVAKQAHDLIKIGEGGKAWALLLTRYRGIHPIVINEPAFRKILAEAARASDDSQAHEIANDQSQGERKAAG